MKNNIKNRTLCLWGCGAVNKAILCYLPLFFDMDYNNIHIYDIIDYKSHPVVKSYLDKGSHYHIIDLNTHFKDIISKLKKGDIILDLTARTKSIEFLKSCVEHNIHYFNTSLECEYTAKEEEKEFDKYELSFSAIQADILEIKAKHPDNKSTCVLNCGMNPGLVNHMMIDSIMFLAKHSKKTQELKIYMKNKDYANICKYLKVCILHCSETDSAKFTERTERNDIQFNSTWCVSGLNDESYLCPEIGLGTHEKSIPKNSELIYDNILRINKPAFYCFSESYVPHDGVIIGSNVPHAESVSMPSFLSVGTQYSPTMHYVYRYCPETFKSFKKLDKKKYLGGNIPNPHVINNYEDKFTSVDRVGCLLVTEDKKSIWCGSILSNDCDDWNSPTTVQVVAGVLSHLIYALKHPDQGCLFPENCDTPEILKVAKPLLGEYFLDFVDYKPKSLNFVDLQRTREEFDSQYKDV